MADAADRAVHEAEHTVSARGLGALLLVTVAVVLGVNALAIRRSPAAERKYDGYIVRTKWDLASQGAPAGGIVVTGDSSGNFAVVASVLEEEFGRPARNYCTYGRFLAIGAGWFLDRSIERAEGPPSLALVVLGARTYAMQPAGFAFAQVPTAFGSWSSRAPHVGLTLAEMGQVAVARLLPLFAQHRSFETGIRMERWVIDTDQLEITPGGTSILPLWRANPNGVARFAEKVIGEMQDFEGSVPSERERRAFEGLVRDAEDRGYDIVFVDGPVWSGLAAQTTHAEFLGRAHVFLDELCATSEHAWHLPGPLQTFEPTVMENPYHLTQDAAVRFSRELSARLRSIGLPR